MDRRQSGSAGAVGDVEESTAERHADVDDVQEHLVSLSSTAERFMLTTNMVVTIAPDVYPDGMGL